MVESLAKKANELTKKLEEATRSKKRQAAPFRKSNSQKKPKEKESTVLVKLAF
jgi:hypothetical protein